MRIRFFLFPVLAGALINAATGPAGWPHWRGPNDDGMAGGDAPLHWSDTEHIEWKAAVPGHGNSSPVAWGDRIFVTTAVPTGKASAASEATPPPGPPPGGPGPGTGAGPGQGQGPGGRRRADGPTGGGPGRRREGFGGPSGPQQEQKFMLLCYDRKTGKLLWE